MERHIKNYLKFFGLDGTEFIPCECGCGRKGHEFHHLKPRSSFGSKRKVEQDRVENVACINAECHRKVHASKEFNQELKEKHAYNVAWRINDAKDFIKNNLTNQI